MGIKLFNMLPMEFKEIVGVNLFKNRLRAYLIGKTFYSVQEYVENTQG